VLGRGGHGEECPGEHGEGGPPVPRGPAPDLMLVQAGQALASGKVLFRAPADSGHAHQRGRRHLARRPAAIKGQFAGVPVAADQQPVASKAAGLDGNPGPVVPAVALGAGPGRQPLPGPGRQLRGQGVHPDRPGTDGHRVALGHGQHVSDLPPFSGWLVIRDRRRRPRRRSPRPPVSRHPAPGRSSAPRVRAWSRTWCPRGCPRQRSVLHP